MLNMTPLLLFTFLIAKFTQNTNVMSCLQVLLALIFPPLAVLDKGCGSVVIVFLLTCAGWIPGVIGALIIINRKR